MNFRFIHCVICLFLIFFMSMSYAADRGIYINPETAANTNKLKSLIENSKEVGINTFVVDYEKNTPKYAENVKMIKEGGIKYIARIVIFPSGGTVQQIRSSSYLQKKAQKIQQAIDLGAQEIQIDYIRYKASQAPSTKNAQDIAKVISYFSQYVHKQNIPLQIDVFGISSFKPSIYIGQDNKLIASKVSAICPMVYPSHYTPFSEHARTPYKTVYSSLVSLKKQIETFPHVKVIAYIEIYNFRYPNMSDTVREKYIMAQFAAVRDSGSDGWYVWSAGNKYNFLFSLLKQMQAGQIKQADFRGTLNATITVKNNHHNNKEKTYSSRRDLMINTALEN